MKIVHINTYGKSGGAAIAVQRLCEAMQNFGIESKMLVIKEFDASRSIYSISTNTTYLYIKNTINTRIHNFLISKFKPKAKYSYMNWGINIKNNHDIKDADIIYLHWVNACGLSIKNIEQILALGKPVYWLMHDMFTITGGCHHSFDCEKYKTGCNNCNLLQKHPIDIANIQFKKKLRSWSKYTNLKILTPSTWLYNCVKESILFKEHFIQLCPNVINTDKYKSINKQFAKELFGISTKKKIILFGANSINDPYKGWEYMRKSLEYLDANEYECLIVGEKNVITNNMLKIPTHFTGHLKDEYSMIMVYNAADVFVTSSIADNFPNVVLEALSCGVPCVGFNIGGIPDLIKNKINGYLAEYKNETDLATGINWIFSDEERYKILCNNARNYIIENYSYNQTMKIHKEITF